MERTHAWRWGVVILALLLDLGACRDRDPNPVEPPAVSRAPTTPDVTQAFEVSPTVRDRVRTRPIGTQVIQETLSAPGEVSLDLKRVAKVTSRIEGQAERIFVRLGDRVTKGQPLVAIGSLKLDELVEEYVVTTAQIEVAENSFRRTQRLRTEDIVPERRLVEERGRYLETKARYQHIREKLRNMGMTAEELAQLEPGQHTERHQYFLRAPLSGTVVRQDVVLGQGISPGTDVFEVVDTSQVWVFANLPIEEATRLKEGQPGTIVPKDGEALTAPLTYIAPIADDKTRTVRVRVEVQNPDGRLKPNEYVDVRFSLAGAPALAVPQSAITTIGKARGVFSVRKGRYAFVPIETGREGGGWVEVRSGLVPGEEVATEGVFDLKNVLLKETIGEGA